MNNKPMTIEVTTKLFTEVQNKIEKASGSETFMLSMAVMRGLGRKFND